MFWTRQILRSSCQDKGRRALAGTASEYPKAPLYEEKSRLPAGALSTAASRPAVCCSRICSTTGVTRKRCRVGTGIIFIITVISVIIAPIPPPGTPAEIIVRPFEIVIPGIIITVIVGSVPRMSWGVPVVGVPRTCTSRDAADKQGAHQKCQGRSFLEPFLHPKFLPHNEPNPAFRRCKSGR